MLFIFLFWSYIYMCVCGGIFYWYDRQKRHSILKAFEIKKNIFHFNHVNLDYQRILLEMGIKYFF